MPPSAWQKSVKEIGSAIERFECVLTALSEGSPDLLNLAPLYDTLGAAGFSRNGIRTSHSSKAKRERQMREEDEIPSIQTRIVEYAFQAESCCCGNGFFSYRSRRSLCGRSRSI